MIVRNGTPLVNVMMLCRPVLVLLRLTMMRVLIIRLRLRIRIVIVVRMMHGMLLDVMMLHRLYDVMMVLVVNVVMANYSVLVTTSIVVGQLVRLLFLRLLMIAQTLRRCFP